MLKALALQVLEPESGSQNPPKQAPSMPVVRRGDRNRGVPRSLRASQPGLCNYEITRDPASNKVEDRLSSNFHPCACHTHEQAHTLTHIHRIFKLYGTAFMLEHVIWGRSGPALPSHELSL